MVEVFGGLAPYCLHAMACEAERSGARAVRHEPPVSRMGNKSGFVRNIKRAFGLTRVRWSAVWMNDLDPVCHLFHLIYASAPLRDAVARRLWAWVPCPVCAPDRVAEALAGTARYTREQCSGWGRAGCDECGGSGVQDARRLWERLRKTPVPMEVIDAAAGAVLMQGRSFGNIPATIDGGQWRCVRGPDVGEPCFKSDDMNGVSVDDFASRVAALPAGLVDVASAAVFLQSRSFGLKPVSVGDGRWIGLFENGSRVGPLADFKPDDGGCGSDHNVRDTLAGKLSKMPASDGLQAIVSRMDAGECLPTGDCSDCVVVLDPPYEGTSGYQAASCRETVLTLARAWHAAGALVLLHEACPLADALGDGWQSRPAGLLRARASTFWGEGGEREWLTCNRKPIWWPAIQQGLF